MELLYKSCYAITALLGIVQGLFVLYKNPRSKINITWACVNFSISLWAIGTPIYIFDTNPQRALVLARCSLYSGILIPVFFTHFCLALLDRPLRTSWLGIAGYIFAVIMAGLCWTPWFVPRLLPKMVFRQYTEPGPLFVAFTIQFVVLVVYAHWLLIRHLRSQSPQRQTQIKYVLLATVLGYTFGSTVFLLVYNIAFNPLPSLFTWIYALITTYAIVKHQLMDIKVAVTKTGILLAIYLIVLGVPFVVGWWGRGWLTQRLGEGWWLIPLGLCTVLATIGPFAYAYLRRKAERALLKGQRRYQRALIQAARGMTRVRDLTKLTRLIVRGVARIVNVQHASLFLWDKDTQRYRLVASDGPKRFSLDSRYALETSQPLIQWLQESRRIVSREELAQGPRLTLEQELASLSAAIIVPGFIEKELVGFLALGEKLSGAGYSADDLNAFSTLANEAAVAIENAHSYEELLTVNEHLRLANDRLVRQERLAAAGQFATGMAHEIKNPLSAIKTFAEYLPEKYQDPAFREKFFKIVQSEIDRINTIVKELLEFAKPAPLQLQPIHLSQLLDETLTLLSNKLFKQGVELHTRFHENGLMIQVDPKQIKQVILNLFLNSLEAMEGGGRIEVETVVRGDYLVLKVTDTGCGIADEHQHKLFDPFFTTKERGMGLGLAVVKGIIDRHGGSIYIRSRFGQGTVVEIQLPVSQTH